MDTPSAAIPSVSPQPAIQPEVSPAEPQSRHWLLWLAGGLTILIFGVSIGIFSAKFLNQPATKSQISSYEDCLAAKGSIVQESYPATCVTVSGQRFVQPLTDEEKQGLQPPDPYREPADSAATTNWKTYENSQIGFQFKYPPEAQLSTTDAETRIHVTVGKLNIVCGYGFNFTIIFKGDDLVKHNDLSTYPFQIAGREVERYDKTDNLEGCRNNMSSIFIKNISNPQINDLVIYITDNSDKQEWSNQILSTFHFLK